MSDTPPTPEDDWEVFTGKALIASKSPWGTLAGGGIAWLATRYGFGWDQITCNLVAGVAIVLASYAMRYFTNEPITGIITAKPILMKIHR